MRLRLLVAVATLSSFAVARADSYSYDFSDTADNWQFTYTSQTLITESAYQTPDTCTIVGEPRSCDFKFYFANGPYPNSIEVEYFYIGFIPQHFYDVGPDFFTVGTHTTGTTTLSISRVPSPTPEPSGLALLGTGVAGLIGLARRRFVL